MKIYEQLKEGSCKIKQSQEAERSNEQSLADDRRDGNKDRLLEELTKARRLLQSLKNSNK